MRRASVAITTILGLVAASGSAAAATLGISADGRYFTIEDQAVFLNGVSYYAGLSISDPKWITDDLDDMAAAGFNWIRVWAYWQFYSAGEDFSALTHDGQIRLPYMDRLKTLITECDARGIIVDCSLNRDAQQKGVGAHNQAEHLVAVRTLARELLPYRNVYIDISNERDIHDGRHVPLAECGELISAIKAIDPARLCTASGVPGSREELGQFRKTARVDFVAPHLCRDKGCSARTLATVAEYAGWMKELGFRMPVHLQEPFRRGYTSYNPTLEDFLRDCSGAKIAEAAGWCLHNGSNGRERPYRSFRMDADSGRLFPQWDDVEKAAVAELGIHIGGNDPRVRRYQAEYGEQLSHTTGLRQASAWSARVADHAAGYLSFGPYITTVPAGRHQAIWQLKAAPSAGAAGDVLLTLDVAAEQGRKILAGRELRRSDLESSQWQEFALPFESRAGDALEFRTLWHDRADVDLDHVTLTIGTAARLAFADITAAAGVAGPDHFGGHGVMWADVTADGRPDLFVTMNRSVDMPELFYRNDGGRAFVEEGARRGIDDPDKGSHGGVWCDLDNDGDYDLVNGGFDRNRVYENNGSGSFADRTANSGFLDAARGTRAALAFDFDRDGDLDVFCNNWAPLGEANEFYRNDGDFRFTSIDNGLGSAIGVQGATEGDYDLDGDLDLLICRGYGYSGDASADGPLMLMRNDDGRFTNVSEPAGLTDTGTTQQGATFCDVNGDGRLDVHVQLQPNDSRLFLNQGDGTFHSALVPAGPGFMAGFEDLDNDGDWDMVYAGDDKVYLNDGQGRFTPSSAFRLGRIHDPRAVAFADIDADGDVDFFYAQKLTHNLLVRNDLRDGGHSLRVRLVSPAGQAGAFGAKVSVYEPGQAGHPKARIAFREARSNEGYLGQNDPVLHFGLGPRLSVDLEVIFLDGTAIIRRSVPADGVCTVGKPATR